MIWQVFLKDFIFHLVHVYRAGDHAYLWHEKKYLIERF